MSERTWTAEPWVASSMGPDEPWFIMADGFDQCPIYVARTDTDETMIPYAEKRANMERAAACVNAMRDIEDPAAFIRETPALRADNARLREACEAAIDPLIAYSNSRRMLAEHQAEDGYCVALGIVRAALTGKAGAQ